MEAATCLRCSKRVFGQVHNIMLTVYCERCFHADDLVESFSSRETHWTWTSSTEAANKEGVNFDDLAALRFKALRRDSDGIHPFSRQYLWAEVESLSFLPRKRIAAEIQARKRERHEKRDALMRATGMQIRDLPTYVQLLLLGEYLSGVCMGPLELDALVARCRVWPRVAQILRVCEGAHPEAAIDFCMQHPDAGPIEFQQLKEKTALVFHLQGFRILGMLWYDVRKLIGTSLRDVSLQFIRRDRIACVRSYLVPMVGLVEAQNIVNHPTCRQRLRQMDPEENDRYVVKQMLKFWNERGSPMEKRHRLSMALSSKGIMPPYDDYICRLCQHYINGTKFILLEEVVRKALEAWMYQVKTDYTKGIWRR